MILYKISLLKCYIIMYSDNVYYIEFKISKKYGYVCFDMWNCVCKIYESFK